MFLEHDVSWHITTRAQRFGPSPRRGFQTNRFHVVQKFEHMYKTVAPGDLKWDHLDGLKRFKFNILSLYCKGWFARRGMARWLLKLYMSRPYKRIAYIVKALEDLAGAPVTVPFSSETLA